VAVTFEQSSVEVEVLGREINGCLRHYPPFIRDCTPAVSASEFLA
jgi:hypothetical protein